MSLRFLISRKLIFRTKLTFVHVLIEQPEVRKRRKNSYKFSYSYKRIELEIELRPKICQYLRVSCIPFSRNHNMI